MGAQAGLGTVLTTGSGPAAERITGLANVLVILRLEDIVLAHQLASLTGTGPTRGGLGAAGVGADGPGGAGLAVPAASAALTPDLRQLRGDEFTLFVKRPSRRLVPAGRFVPGRLG